ncbi:MAG: septum formation family protein [Propionibacteriaceae bacterium]|nr:septum formation family protein [Propionibacteriaceae bacterium]
MIRIGCLSAALVALGALGFAGCSAEGPRNSAGQVTASAPTDAFSLQVGDCTGPLTSGTVGEVTLVPCSQPHAWEVFAATELQGDDFPGAGKVQDLAEEFCNDQFKAFIGLSVSKSDYHLTVLQPTKQTWNDAGDRQVTCLAGDGEGKIEGSLRGVEE